MRVQSTFELSSNPSPINNEMCFLLCIGLALRESKPFKDQTQSALYKESVRTAL